MKDDRKIKFEIFPWHKNFETGIPLIDEQHQQLVHILNQLAAHLANRSSPIILNEIFDELAHYADYHFKAEEMIWVAHFKDDEWYSRHELTHGSFINDVIALKSEENTKTLDDTIQDIVSFLSHWLAYHILDTDKRMAKVVLALESGMSLEQAKIFANEEMAGATKILIDTVLTMYDNLLLRTLDLIREQARRKQAEASLKQSEERWQFILENRSDNIWDWNLEQDGAMHSQNTALESDHLSHEILKTAQKSTIHKDDLAQVKLALKNHLEGKSEFFVSKHRIVDEEG